PHAESRNLMSRSFIELNVLQILLERLASHRINKPGHNAQSANQPTRAHPPLFESRHLDGPTFGTVPRSPRPILDWLSIFTPQPIHPVRKHHDDGQTEQMGKLRWIANRRKVRQSVKPPVKRRVSAKR